MFVIFFLGFGFGEFAVLGFPIYVKFGILDFGCWVFLFVLSFSVGGFRILVVCSFLGFRISGAFEIFDCWFWEFCGLGFRS